MLYKLIISSFIILISLSFNATAKDIDETSIKTFLSEFDNSVRNHDIESISDKISSDAVIELHVYFDGEMEVMKPTKEEYLALLQIGYAMSREYKYDRNNIQINIDKKEKQALVKSVIEERVVTKSNEVEEGPSRVEQIIKPLNGNLYIVKMVMREIK